MGIYSIKKFGLTSNKGRDRVGVGIRSSYIRVLGIQVDTDGSGELALALPKGCAAPWLSPRCLPELLLGLLPVLAPALFHTAVRVSGAVITTGTTSFLG